MINDKPIPCPSRRKALLRRAAEALRTAAADPGSWSSMS